MLFKFIIYKNNSDCAEAFTGLGLCLKEAEASFESVVHLQPDSALGLGNVAGLYYDQVRSLFFV